MLISVRPKENRSPSHFAKEDFGIPHDVQYDPKEILKPDKDEPLMEFIPFPGLDFLIPHCSFDVDPIVCTVERPSEGALKTCLS